MSDLNRRQVLRAFLRGVLPAAGTAVLAVAVVPAVQASVDRAAGNALRQRADRLAVAAGQGGEGDPEFCRFVNGGFANAGFRNGASGGTAFKNGAFNNGGGSAFRNGSTGGGTFNNGGFKNGGFVNGAFRNG